MRLFLFPEEERVGAMLREAFRGFVVLQSAQGIRPKKAANILRGHGVPGG